MFYLAPLSGALLVLAVTIHGQIVIPVTLNPDSWWSRNFPGLPDPTFCPELLRPANGSVSVVDNAGIVKAIYSCHTNYSLVGDSHVKCACGEWTGELALCRRDGSWTSWSEWSDCSVPECGGGIRTRNRSCEDPPPEPGGKNCPGDKTDEERCNEAPCPVCVIQNSVVIGDLTLAVEDRGRTVRFSCPSDYILIGNSTLPCSQLDLTAVEAFCVLICPELNDPKNGNVALNEEKTIALFSCQIGFSLQGSRERVCQDGIWSGTDTICVTDLIAIGENKLELTGANPEIGLGEGTFIIESPPLFIGQCNGTVTFDIRASNKDSKVTVDVSLITNETIATNNLEVEVLSADIPQPVCVPLVCPNPENLLLPQVGRVNITVVVQAGVAEVSSVSFRDGRKCEDTEDDLFNSCDDGTASGDCGFRDTGCGSGSFEVTLESDDDSEDSEDVEANITVPLLARPVSDRCHYYTCSSCLQSSGITVSRVTPTNGTGQSTMSRRKRAVKVKKSFCVKPTEKKPKSGSMEIGKVDKGDKNEYLSFIHNMKKGGAHELVVYVDVPCQKRSFHIHLAEFKVPYKITNYDRKGNVERVCLNLHKHIEDEFGNKCKKFQVIFEGYAAAKKLCVNDLFYLRKSDVMKNGKWKGHPKCPKLFN